MSAITSSELASLSSFPGYRRKDGKVGLRNHLAVIPASVCASAVAARIAEQIPSAVALANQHGCCQVGADYEQTLRTLVGLGRNPNVGAALVIGLGCENVSAAEVCAAIAASGKPAAWLLIQKCGGAPATVAEGVRLAAGFDSELSGAARAACPVSEIFLGLECGGSDYTSGLVSNPAAGEASDLLLKAGGTSLLSETTEFIGAEHILAARCRTQEIAQKLLGIVKACEERSLAMNVDLRGSQPTPGNIEGGITTIEEKSLGCIYKAGTAPVEDVLYYAQAPAGKGLYVMDSPGQDVDSITGMVAGGATVIVFSTGRGTPTGSPLAPVIKVTANAETAVIMRDHIDIDASPVLSGEKTIAEMGEAILRHIVEVAGGRLTKAESLGHREFGIYRIGPTF